MFGSRGSRDETRRFKIEITRRDGKTRFSKNRDVRRDARRLVSFSSRDLETKPRLVSWHYIQKIRFFLVLDNMEFSCVFEVFWAFFSEKLTKFETRSWNETRLVSSRLGEMKSNETRLKISKTETWDETETSRFFLETRRDVSTRFRLEISRRSDRDLARLQTLERMAFLI